MKKRSLGIFTKDDNKVKEYEVTNADFNDCVDSNKKNYLYDFVKSHLNSPEYDSHFDVSENTSESKVVFRFREMDAAALMKLSDVKLRFPIFYELLTTLMNFQVSNTGDISARVNEVFGDVLKRLRHELNLMLLKKTKAAAAAGGGIKKVTLKNKKESSSSAAAAKKKKKKNNKTVRGGGGGNKKQKKKKKSDSDDSDDSDDDDDDDDDQDDTDDDDDKDSAADDDDDKDNAADDDANDDDEDDDNNKKNASAKSSTRRRRQTRGNAPKKTKSRMPKQE